MKKSALARPSHPTCMIIVTALIALALPCHAAASDTFVSLSGRTAPLSGPDAVLEGSTGFVHLARTITLPSSYIDNSTGLYIAPTLGLTWRVHYGAVEFALEQSGHVKRWFSTAPENGPVLTRFDSSTGIGLVELKVAVGRAEEWHWAPELEGPLTTFTLQLFDSDAFDYENASGVAEAIDEQALVVHPRAAPARISAHRHGVIPGQEFLVTVSLNDAALAGVPLYLVAFDSGTLALPDLGGPVSFQDAGQSNFYRVRAGNPGQTVLQLRMANGTPVASSELVRVGWGEPGRTIANANGALVGPGSPSGASIDYLAMAINAPEGSGDPPPGVDPEIKLGEICIPAKASTQSFAEVCADCPDTGFLHAILTGANWEPEQPDCYPAAVVYTVYGCMESSNEEDQCDESEPRTIEGPLFEFGGTLNTYVCYEGGLTLPTPNPYNLPTVTINYPIWVWCCTYSQVVPGETASATIDDCATL